MVDDEKEWRGDIRLAAHVDTHTLTQRSPHTHTQGMKQGGAREIKRKGESERSHAIKRETGRKKEQETERA